MRLLSVAVLTAKGISVLFTPSRALMIDIEDGFKIIGQPLRSADWALLHLQQRRCIRLQPSF